MEFGIDPITMETKVDSSVPIDARGEEITEGNDPECAQLIEDILKNYGLDSDSAYQSCSVDKHSEEKEPKENPTSDSTPSAHNQQSSCNDSQITTEEILLGFYKAFQKANRQLKRNDATLLELLREQNEIFKSQNALIKKLIASD